MHDNKKWYSRINTYISYVAMYKWKTMKANICTYISRHIIM